MPPPARRSSKASAESARCSRTSDEPIGRRERQRARLALRSARSQELRDRGVAFFDRVVGGRVASNAYRVRIGAMVEEHPDALEVPVLRGFVEARGVPLAPRIRV